MMTTGKSTFNPKDYDDYPMGDERTYQNRKKYGSSIHPNSNAAKMYKRLKEGTTKGAAKHKALHERLKKAKGYGEK